MSKIAVIIPCHNESKRLNTETFCGFLALHPDVHMIFVNDGSTDDTATVLETIRSAWPLRVKLISLPKKKGKAEAVRAGLLQSVQEKDITYHGFLDADLAVSLEELLRLYHILIGTGKKFIFGSRIKKIGAVIIRNEWRHFYSRIIATGVGFITKLDVYDTQCSAKIFHAELIPSFATQPFRTKWLFDIELINRIHQHTGNLNETGHEEPLLEWKEIAGSKLRWYNFFRIVREIAILYKYHRAK